MLLKKRNNCVLVKSLQKSRTYLGVECKTLGLELPEGILPTQMKNLGLSHIPHQKKKECKKKDAMVVGGFLHVRVRILTFWGIPHFVGVSHIFVGLSHTLVGVSHLPCRGIPPTTSEFSGYPTNKIYQPKDIFSIKFCKD